MALVEAITPDQRSNHVWSRQPSRDAARGGLAPWQLARVGGHIERRLASRLTNSRLASLVRLSEDHFARAFKVSIGCSPHAYVVARRVERAKVLMLESDLPLSQIAVAAGFSDQSHLSRCFRARVGAAPGSWRRRFSRQPTSDRRPRAQQYPRALQQGEK